MRLICVRKARRLAATQTLSRLEVAVRKMKIPIPHRDWPRGRAASLRKSLRKCMRHSILAACVLVFAIPASGQDVSEVSELLRARLEDFDGVSRIVVEDDVVFGSELLPAFYASRDFSPAWVDANAPLPILEDLLQEVRRAEDHGLRPTDYHLELLDRKLGEHARTGGSASRLVEIELLATDAFLVYASHLLAGHLNPETSTVAWFVARPEADLVALLRDAIESRDVKSAFVRVTPAHAAYDRLKNALRQYRSVAQRGGWSMVPQGPTLREGARGGPTADRTDPRQPGTVAMASRESWESLRCRQHRRLSALRRGVGTGGDDDASDRRKTVS